MNWYCLYTRPKKETQVESYCRNRLGIETYCPQLREYKTIRCVRRSVTGPLFPRYLFCRFNLAESYRAVRYAPDALGLVAAGDRPADVADALIAELKQWAGPTVDASAVRPPLSAGEAVRITSGPLRGLTAVILNARDDQDRVAILLSLLNSGAKLSIRRDWLEPENDRFSPDEDTHTVEPGRVLTL